MKVEIWIGMHKVRDRFHEIIKGWNNVTDIDDIPKRLRKLDHEFGEQYDQEEQKVVNFMKEVQQLRERFGKKKK